MIQALAFLSTLLQLLPNLCYLQVLVLVPKVPKVNFLEVPRLMLNAANMLPTHSVGSLSSNPEPWAVGSGTDRMERVLLT